MGLKTGEVQDPLYPDCIQVRRTLGFKVSRTSQYSLLIHQRVLVETLIETLISNIIIYLPNSMI